MPDPDIAEFLKARMLADLQGAPDLSAEAIEGCRLAVLEAQISTLEDAVAAVQTLGEQRRQEAETAGEHIAALKAQVATLKKTVAEAEAIGEQHRQEAEASAERAVYLVTELIDVTSELVELQQACDSSGAERAASAHTFGAITPRRSFSHLSVDAGQCACRRRA